jgi:NAD(P)-dependent dehydrogenase (short-subunit alcohol dehydrogenase family)
MTIALVTGATRGLGFAASRALAQVGACVLLSGRTAADAEKAAASLRQEGLDAQPLKLDVTSASSIQAASQQATSAADP